MAYLRNREFKTITGLLGEFLGLLKGHYLYLINTDVGSVFPWLSRKVSVLKAGCFQYLMLGSYASVAPQRAIVIYSFCII